MPLLDQGSFLYSLRTRIYTLFVYWLEIYSTTSKLHRHTYACEVYRYACEARDTSSWNMRIFVQSFAPGTPIYASTGVYCARA